VAAVQVDDLLTFRQVSKKAADEAIDVCSFLIFVFVADDSALVQRGSRAGNGR
jgi:hypothetical protein